MAPGRVLILGGGFAGVKCARKLRSLLPRDKYDIVLFNRENHMVFHPLLAEVASAAIQPKDVAAPLRQLLHGVQCRTEEVLNIHLAENFIEYEA
ncbi:MAG TPA: FAD-dependent oxidoreductase, partial [Candidatus Obscuribacterales bacterium]